jgi:hypothetical protein
MLLFNFFFVVRDLFQGAMMKSVDVIIQIKQNHTHQQIPINKQIKSVKKAH